MHALKAEPCQTPAKPHLRIWEQSSEQDETPTATPHPSPSVTFTAEQVAALLNLQSRDLRTLTPSVAPTNSNPSTTASSQSTSTTALSDIFTAFLKWSSTNRSAKTTARYSDFLDDFSKTAGHIPAEALTAASVYDWLDSKPRWNPTTKHKAVGAISRALNWATRTTKLSRNPIEKIERPQPLAREHWMTEAQHLEVLNHTPDYAGKALFVLAWETGARPQELFRVTASHFEPSVPCFRLPPSQSKTRTTRLIFLSPRAAALVADLCTQHPTGPLLLNSENKPWTNLSVDCRLKRLAKKGLPKWDLYHWRHGFAVRMLEAGHDALKVATLLGHSGLEMLKKHYGHLLQRPQSLAALLDSRRNPATSPEST